jgi:hypothetical protein
MNRLYVLVRGDLSSSQQAVQAGHAVGAWMLQDNSWKNEVLVYLAVKDENELLGWADFLEAKGFP